MTNLRTAAQQALEALTSRDGDGWTRRFARDRAIEALEAALAQQAWACPESPEHRYAKPGHCEDCGRTLVRAQQAEPVAFDWPRKACPCRDVQNGECLKLGCKWERDPSLVPEALRRQAGMHQAEPVGTVRVDAGEVHIIPAIRDADRSPLKDGQAVYAAPPQQAEPVEPVAWVNAVMEQAQIFASAWSLVGGRFDDGTGLKTAEQEKETLRSMLYAAPPQRKPLTDEEIPALAEKVLKPSVYYDAEALLGTDGLVALVRAVERAHGIKERP